MRRPKPDEASRFTCSSTAWMFTGSRSTGRSSANTSMRSTSFTMRSASSQMSFVSDGALLQHHHDVAGLLRHGRDVQVDEAVAGHARRGQIDLVFVHRGTAAAHLL